MEKTLEKIYNDTEFINIIKDIIENDTVNQMKIYKQHYETSCFDHCLSILQKISFRLHIL